MKSTAFGVRFPAALFVLCALAFIWAGASPALAGVNLSPEQEKRLLAAMNNAPRNILLNLPGITEKAAAKIVDYRDSGKSFTSVAIIRSVAGLAPQQYDELAGRFQKLLLDKGRSLSDPAQMPTQQNRAGNALEQRTRARGDGGTAARDSEPGSKGSGTLNLEVRGKYYSILPGYDLSDLSDKERRTFLETINAEMCPCGCRGETLGYCLVNDPGCMVVRARVKKIYKDVTGKEPPVEASASKQ